MSGTYRHSMTSLDLANTQMHSRQLQCFLFQIEILWESFTFKTSFSCIDLCEPTVNDLII